MRELGYGENYSYYIRHLVLQPQEISKISLRSDLLLLLEMNETIVIESEFGFFDMARQQTNELQYEHRGDVRIHNDSVFIQHIRFIQVIPIQTAAIT
jgi:hypothetical protein